MKGPLGRQRAASGGCKPHPPFRQSGPRAVPFTQRRVYHLYDLKKLGHVLEECSICKASYVPEPGFYFGAMYVSYGLGVALFVSIWASANWFFEEVSVGLQITLVIGSIFLFGPFIYALSKIIWANMFIHYKENDAK